MSGNCKILTKLLAKWGSYLSNAIDKFKKTPAMYAIRNRNN
jgi:ankyrin repeat protein